MMKLDKVDWFVSFEVFFRIFNMVTSGNVLDDSSYASLSHISGSSKHSIYGGIKLINKRAIVSEYGGVFRSIGYFLLLEY